MIWDDHLETSLYGREFGGERGLQEGSTGNNCIGWGLVRHATLWLGHLNTIKLLYVSSEDLYMLQLNSH